MRITVATGEMTSIQTPALVANLFKGVTEPGGATGAVDKAFDGAISRLIREGEIKGTQGAISMLHILGKAYPTEW
jgi:leucyl aminopeptidase